MRTLYERLPELSVDAPQLRLTLVSVMLVTTRFVGAVGADLSPLPAAELIGPLKKRLVVRASVAIPRVRRERCRVHMMDPPHNESFQDRVGLHKKSLFCFFSVQPLCALCLCGCFF